MRDIYLGDSFDIVKRFWAVALRDVAPMYAHPRFVATDLRPRFCKLTTVLILDPDRLPDGPFGLLLDPHTGIPLPDARRQKVNIAFAPVSFIAEQFTKLRPTFMARDRGTLTRVRNALTATGIPEQTPSTIRLQPIQVSKPEQADGPERPAAEVFDSG